MLTHGYDFDNILCSICVRELCILVCHLTKCVHVCRVLGGNECKEEGGKG